MTDNAVTVTAPEGVPFIDIIREFDAPVDEVYRAHRESDLVAKWLGPDGYEMDIAEWDLRSGGRYSFLHRTPSGEEYGFHGVFHTARDSETIIQTFEFEGFPDVVSIETMRLERLDGDRTLMTVHAVYPSLDARDGMIASGMETGLSQGYRRLDALLAAS